MRPFWITWIAFGVCLIAAGAAALFAIAAFFSADPWDWYFRPLLFAVASVAAVAALILALKNTVKRSTCTDAQVKSELVVIGVVATCVMLLGSGAYYVFDTRTVSYQGAAYKVPRDYGQLAGGAFRLQLCTSDWAPRFAKECPREEGKHAYFDLNLEPADNTGDWLLSIHKRLDGVAPVAEQGTFGLLPLYSLQDFQDSFLIVEESNRARGLAAGNGDAQYTVFFDTEMGELRFPIDASGAEAILNVALASRARALDLIESFRVTE